MHRLFVIGVGDDDFELTKGVSLPPHWLTTHFKEGDEIPANDRPDLILASSALSKGYIDSNINTRSGICPIMFI